MTGAALLLLLAGLALIGWLLGRARALTFSRAGGRYRVLPQHHAAYVALWTAAPALLFCLLWSVASPGLVLGEVLRAPAALSLPTGGFERSAILDEARGVAEGRAYGAFYDLSYALAPAFGEAQTRFRWIGTGLAMLLAVLGGVLALVRTSPRLQVRDRLNGWITAGLLAASLIAILTTAGIFLSLLFESVSFFRAVSPLDFLFGTHWSPQVISTRDPGASLGAVPLFWGTFFIGVVIAMAVAIPLGLLSAIYLSQYARPRVRRWMKPTLEMLAGVPTVVYGYFAATIVGPTIRDAAVALGRGDASSESALAAGLVMGVMIVPFISSMADDALAAVPDTMRDGSLALGATAGETVRQVLLPAALPGVVAGILLAVSRAIGETMIVVMAASGAATLSLDPLDSATTVTKQIVDLLTGEATFDSPKTLAAFALGLTLFALTFLLNIIALTVVQRFREAYE